MPRLKYTLALGVLKFLCSIACIWLLPAYLILFGSCRNRNKDVNFDRKIKTMLRIVDNWSRKTYILKFFGLMDKIISAVGFYFSVSPGNHFQLRTAIFFVFSTTPLSQVCSQLLQASSTGGKLYAPDESSHLGWNQYSTVLSGLTRGVSWLPPPPNLSS